MGDVHVEGFDHFVLVCADVERSLAWYLDELGLAAVRVDEWRRHEVPFPSVRVSPETIIDLIPGTVSGRNVDHVCLVVDQGSVDHVVSSGRFTVVDGPDQRFGARGMATSVYVTDPDGNVVELRAYPAD
jgi:catechol 2,3-dioxygenase-like lactoylglutathione lyase family enzyme